jgi:hypothetical protein
MSAIRVDEREHGGEDGGIILMPEEEAELERVIAETDEDERSGRVFTLEQVLADLRRS